MMKTRIEHDLLGDREVPADAYWGVHTLRAVENFPISGRTVGEIPELVRALAAIKQAAALACTTTPATVTWAGRCRPPPHKSLPK